MRRLVGKKAAAIVIVAALIIGLSGPAIAYVLGNGSGSGSGAGSVGSGSGFTVSSPGLQGGPLTINPNNTDTIWSSISNFTGLPLTLYQIQVAITGVTPNANSQNPAFPPCTASQFVLSAPSTSPWQGLTANGPVETGPTAIWTQNLPLTVPNASYVTDSQGTTSSVVNAVPPGLKLEWLNLGPSVIQNNCLGATVNVTVSVNGQGSSGGGPSNAASFVVTKSASPSTVYVGASTPITYTLTAQNKGGDSGDAFIWDTVPSGTTLVSGSNSCPSLTPPTTCSTSVAGSTINWTIANVPAGGSVAVTFEVTANPADSTGTISNTAYWNGPGCASSVSCPTNPTTTNVTAPTRLLITASSTTTVYGGATPVVTPEYTPSIVGTLATPPTCTSTVTATTVVGTYAAANTCSGASDPAYVITYAPGKAVVDPAPLTVTASSGLFPQGGTPPTITAAFSGFQNGENPSSLTTPPTCSTTATSASTPGPYPTTCAGAVDPNYTISYVPGSVTVTPAATQPATSPATTPPATSPATTTSPTASVSTSPAIAFTGALLSEEWLIGMATVLLGFALVVLARWRRRTPKQAAK